MVLPGDCKAARLFGHHGESLVRSLHQLPRSPVELERWPDDDRRSRGAHEGVASSGLRDVGGRASVHVCQLDAFEIARDYLGGVEHEHRLPFIHVHLGEVPPTLLVGEEKHSGVDQAEPVRDAQPTPGRSRAAA